MFSRIALFFLGIALTSQAVAVTHTQPSGEICRQTRPMMRTLWSTDGYDASPAVAALMVDAIDGKLSAVRQQLQTMQRADAVRWRQTAMVTAAWNGQAAVVEGLLDDGAAVDALAPMPPFKPGLFDQTVDGMKRDPHFGGPDGVKHAMATGLISSQGGFVGPALMVATKCGDVATLNVLLHHHANVAQRRTPDAPDALTVATVNGDADAVQFLIDHGADPCADDRHVARIHRKSSRRGKYTLAQIGTRSKLPAPLVARLTCPAVAIAH